LNKAWTKDFLNHYKREVRKPFIFLTVANLVDEEIVKRLKEANCYGVFFGIESGNERVRKNILKRDMTNKQILRAAKLFRKEGILWRPYNMLGIPGETLKEAWETVDLNIAAKPDVTYCSLFMPYPGTELKELALREGLIDGRENEEVSYFLETPLRQKEIKKVSNLQKLFFFTVKFPFLKPIVKRIISFPPNFLFNLLFLFSFAYVFAKSHNMNPLEAAYWHARNIKNYGAI